MPKLTPKQSRFVDEYLIDLNATQAYIRAGYAPSTPNAVQVNACRLLSNVKVASAIAEKQAVVAQRNDVTVDRVIQEYVRVAFADPRKVMSWGPDGVRLRESSELTDDEAALVAEVSETTSKDGGSLKLKLHSKTQALHDLATHLGMFPKDGIVVNVDARQQSVNLSGLTDDEIRKLISG